jgi:ABC-type multidrug transport system ATPase subunit
MKIELLGATRSFGSVPVLHQISLTVEPGQVVALLGANGSGKTTLFRCVSGILLLDQGELRCDGEVFRRDRIDLRRRMFFLPDFPAVFPEMTLIRHIEMVLQLYECDQPGIEEKVVELLREFDLLPLVDCSLGTVSRGQAYKAALAALLAVDPELWLLDEPFASGVDARGLSAFRRHCKEATNRGRTVIYSTQLIEVVDGFADQICVLNKGRLIHFSNIFNFQQALADPHSPLAEAFGS